jgi:outer membrane protein assembly factor BamB
MAFPGNVVTDGTDIWYPVDNGSVQRAPVVNLTPVSSLTGFGAGTIYGLSLFGTKLAGGGGGAGVGRLFVANKDGNNITGYNPARHVSGVAVGRLSGNDVLFAVTQETNNTAVLRRFDSAGNVDAETSSFGSFPTTTPGATTPVLGAGGFVYAVSNEGNVVAVDATSMAVRWRRNLGLANAGQVVASATLDCNRTKPGSGTGVYYFVTTGGWLVAYVVDSPGLDTNAPWPKYQHDARNTGNLHASKACP